MNRWGGLGALMACLAAGCTPAPDARSSSWPAAGPWPVSLCFVREGEYLPEYGGWPVEDPGIDFKIDLPAETEKAAADWKKKAKWVGTQVTPGLVRSLSGWAQTEMESYRAVPDFEKVNVVFKPVRANRHRKIVFEGILDTLPTHSPGSVTRWLTAFLLYDMDTHSILRVTITVTGQKLE